MTKFFNSFDPDERTPRRRPRQMPQVPVRIVAPNLVTLLALCAGLTAIRFAFEGRLDIAIYAILFAAALDGLDGRVARLLRSTSRFGAQLDSLADFVNFGVAPALLAYTWALSDLGSFGWVGSLVFAICVALRLARFNVAADGPERPAWQKGFFIGVPAPAGAVIALLPLYLELLGAPHGAWTGPLAMAYLVAIGLLMISRVPTWSGRMIGRMIPRDLVAPIFITAVIVFALLFSFTWLALTIGTLAYLAVIPISWRAWREQMRTAHEPEPDSTNVERFPLRDLAVGDLDVDGRPGKRRQ